MLNSIKDFLKAIFSSVLDFVAENVSLTIFIVVSVIVVYYLFFANRSVNLDVETQLEKQRREIEEKRWEFEKRLSHEWRKGFRISFFFTTALWMVLSFAFFQYGFSDTLRTLLQVPLQRIQKTERISGSTAKQYRLYVKTTPKDSKIRILNVFQRYEYGMQLPAGHYMLEITAPKYRTKYECVIIENRNVAISVTLIAICCK